MTNVTAAKRAPEAAGKLPRALPAWVYNHPDLSRLEHERILMPSWQIVCHVNSIPKSGDFVTFDLGPESVMVMRDREGAIRGFHNVCRHRGARLLDGAGNCPATITCPYHGWTYRHDGGLIGMPVRESFPGLDRGEHGLRPVRTDVAFGFVFACLAGDPPPVSSVWGKLVEEFRPYRFEEMVPLGPITEEVWEVDWKIAMDNYLESYHVPIGHPGLYRMFTPDYEDQASVPGVARGVSWMRDQESPRWAERHYQRMVAGVVTHLPEENRRCWRFYSALPNLGIDVFPDQMDFFQLLPKGPGRCTVRGGVFGLPDDRREMRAVRYLSSRINTQVNDEDRWLCARVQRGLASGSYKPGPLSQLERWMLEFHELLRARIPEFKLASAPKQFA
ncbi:MAG TPA: aromatic ring-hydroxylating dioxygenase subunit alpha [Steroidobacteraceae bacterium]|jgi:phenylpropionate dioxygenase-like ring-hydroxylating dioxygenase large terminal subunit|nr:aromatic ring-hydroxylating dioxygenase subunit alpha [Steroidobacteraceae bacterium]